MARAGAAVRPALAVVVSMPGRETVLRRALASLRPQVDELYVFWNGPVMGLPGALRCPTVIDPHNTRGSGAKLHWAASWDGLYLACDDDLEYPPDYVATMRRWVEQWDRRALVTCHGRVLRPTATRFKDAEFTAHALRDVPEGQWLNYPGGCALAFDTSLGVPADLPGKNVEEAGLAVWAQRQGVPIWLVPHTAAWLGYTLPPGAPTIWDEESRTGFRNRNSALVGVPEWVVHQPTVLAP